ncbi:hypothetical protein M8J77_016452 [Diaphorina citri]|nr:hypothetical protein M8J77_016452 [Diaphorina citri]
MPSLFYSILFYSIQNLLGLIIQNTQETIGFPLDQLQTQRVVREFNMAPTNSLLILFYSKLTWLDHPEHTGDHWVSPRPAADTACCPRIQYGANECPPYSILFKTYLA